MREQITFTVCGNRYRHKQYAAIKGLYLLDKLDKVDPIEILGDLEILDNDKWIKIKTDNIDTFIKDKADVISPLEVLRTVMGFITEQNLGFIKTWECLIVPQRFVVNSDAVSVPNIDPLVSMLIQCEYATLKDLETYYSTKDAFDMFDIAMAKGINDALANEAMMNKK